MSHDGETHRAAPGGPQATPVMTQGPAVNELLARRYQLAELVDTDAAGRQIWRGIDTVLRRPVAVVVREPGGAAAANMITTSVAISRLVHPHIVSVYDAIDEGDRAYLVREWVPGIALRDVLRQSPLDAERATLVTHAIAEAVAALHAAGVVHGNIHPGTILIADDGRVVLTDAHSDNPADPLSDVRAIGGVLYACLTSHWPHAEAGHATLPDAPRDAAGRLASPRQIHGGVPAHLDEIAAELLDPAAPVAHAAVLAEEFARLATAAPEPYYDDAGPIGFGHSDVVPARRRGGKLALGVTVLAAIAVAGAFAGARVLGADPSGGTTTPPADSTPSTAASAGAGTPIDLTNAVVRIVDPPKGDRAEVRDAELTIDGDQQTGWGTDEYNSAEFGGLKPGMGVLIDLGAPTKVKAVRVFVSQQGASVALRTGTSLPDSSTAGDKEINDTYATVAPALDDAGTNMVFAVPDDQQELQYLLVWITKLPADADGKFTIAVNEIVVLAP